MNTYVNGMHLYTNAELTEKEVREIFGLPVSLEKAMEKERREYEKNPYFHTWPGEKLENVIRERAESAFSAAEVVHTQKSWSVFDENVHYAPWLRRGKRIGKEVFAAKGKNLKCPVVLTCFDPKSFAFAIILNDTMPVVHEDGIGEMFSEKGEQKMIKAVAGLLKMKQFKKQFDEAQKLLQDENTREIGKQKLEELRPLFMGEPKKADPSTLKEVLNLSQPLEQIERFCQEKDPETARSMFEELTGLEVCRVK